MSGSLIKHPHIYVDGKILNFPQLDEGVDEAVKSFVFSTTQSASNITNITRSTNNINQITGRCLLGMYKLLSYFGLTTDPTEKLSKMPSSFDKFSTFFKREKDDLEDLKSQLEHQKILICELTNQVKELKREEIPISRDEVINFTQKLTEIEVYLRQILG